MENNLNEKYFNISVSEEPECRRIISIEVAPERFHDERERVLGGMLKTVALPGFRKGKVPVDIARQRFSDEIKAEALKSILPVAYGHAVTAEKLQPIGEPVFSDIRARENEPVTFRVEVEVVPDITLDGYRGITVEDEKVEVNGEEIDSVLENLQKREAEYVDVDRPAVTGDVVVIDYAPVKLDGTVNGKKRITDYPIQLGAGQLFPAFEEAVAGTAAGATARVDITYPEDFQPERLAGRTMTYEFAVKEVKERRLHALDDAFAAKIDASFKTIADLREDLAKRYLAEKEKEARKKREEAAIDRIIEENPFEVPRSMLERFRNELWADGERRREAMGMAPEEDADKRKEIEEAIEKVARRSIKRYFLIEHIADKEGIKIGDEELHAEIERIARETERPAGEVEAFFAPKSEHRSKLEDALRERRVFEIILGGSGSA